MTTDNNPLLMGEGLPHFTEINPAHVTPKNGPWLITLDYASFGSFLKCSDRRELNYMSMD